MAFYKVTMVLESDSHPRKWVADAIWTNLNDGEDILEIDCEELENYEKQVDY